MARGLHCPFVCRSREPKCYPLKTQPAPPNDSHPSNLNQPKTYSPATTMPKPKTLSTVKYYLPVLLKEQESIHAANQKKRQILFANTFAAVLVFLVTLAIINAMGLTQGLSLEIQSFINR